MKRAACAALLLLGAAAACGGTRADAPATPAPHRGATVPANGAYDARPDGGADDDTDRAEGDLASKESAAVARTLVRVTELRGLAAKKPVPGVKLGRDKLVGRVRDKALREYPPEVLKREGLVLQLMDFAPVGFDYLAETMKLLEAQLEGFYEPKNGTMYLAADLKGPEAQATLAHELVHALQDQHWDLRSRSDYKPGRSDETLALAALAEGDATSLMMDFILAEQGQSATDLPDDVMRSMMASSMQMGNIKSVPHVLRTSLVAPYVEGLAFVNALRRKGGWAMVDKAWAALPKTTEQVLHVDKWESHEAAIAIPTPTAQALGPGWSMDEEDTAGELGYALSFEEWMGPIEARIAAAGWGGDRTAVFAKGSELATVDHLRFDEAAPKKEALAERAYAKLAKALSTKYGKPAATSPTFVCFERPKTGPFAVLRRARDLVFVAGPAKVTDAGWTSTGTCTQARAWADEVAVSGGNK